MDVHIWQLITAIHSTVTCMYRASSMNHTRLIFVKMNFNGYYLLLVIRLWKYLAYTTLLKDNVTTYFSAERVSSIFLICLLFDRRLPNH